jgi:hypothetical protein
VPRETVRNIAKKARQLLNEENVIVDAPISKSGKLDREKSTQSFNAEFLLSTALVVNIVFFMSARFRTSKIILVLKIWLSFFINQSTNPGATRFHLS